MRGKDGERVARCGEESEKTWKGKCFKGKGVIKTDYWEVICCGN